MKHLKIVTLLTLLLASPLSVAEGLGLYQDVVEVPDQSEAARATGMQQAMANVLLKVSGTFRTQEDELLVAAMGGASRFVQQYRYRSEAIPEEQQKPDESGNIAKERLLLSVHFDQNSIDELLRQHGYTIWGDTRPATLIWLGVEQGGRRVLVGANDSGLVREMIDKEAARRALPVKLPLLDLTDRSAVRIADIWGEFIGAIQQASQRYHPQAVLVGRIYPALGGVWEVNWTLSYQGEMFHWTLQSAEVSELIANGIGNTAEQLVQRFAESFVSGKEVIQLEIDGVRGLKDYGRVMDYLAGLPGVKEVTTNKMTPTSLSINIRTEGGSQAALQTIVLGDVLEEVQPVPGTEVPSQNSETPSDGGDPSQQQIPKILYYRLIP